MALFSLSFLTGVIDVIGRDFGPITFTSVANQLLLLDISARVIEVIDVIGTFGFGGVGVR